MEAINTLSKSQENIASNTRSRAATPQTSSTPTTSQERSRASKKKAQQPTPQPLPLPPQKPPRQIRPPSPEPVIFEEVMAERYHGWGEHLSPFEFGGWYMPSDLMRLRAYLSGINFGVVSARQEAITKIAAFFASGVYDIVSDQERFPERKLLSDQDGWYRILQRINAALSIKIGDKDVKKTRANNEQAGSRSNEEIETGNFSDSQKSFISDLALLGVTEVWTRAKFEATKGLRWGV